MHPLVGRASELDELTSWFDEVADGAPRVVVVSGEAGIGKSRLVRALAERAIEAGATVLEGRTTELDGAPPYWPWLQVLAGLEAAAVLETPAGADPASERFARFEAVADALAHAGDAPLVAVLEDLHRADDASLRLLVHVAGRLVGVPVLVVATARSTPLDQVPGLAAAVDELARLPGFRRLVLEGLDRPAVEALLGPGTNPGVVDRVLADTRGNALLIGEVAHHLGRGGDPATVPRSVRDAVWLRLDELSAGCVEVVRVAAVLGRTFEAGLVATATGRPALVCLEDLDEAVSAGLLEPTGRAGWFRFLHALVRDAVEASLGAAELAVLHQRAARAVESYGGSPESRAADLARHWDAASVLGDRSTAAHWCERAAVVADEQLAWEEAARLYDRALELGGGTDDPVARWTRAIGSARARLHGDEIGASVARSVTAAEAAREAARPDLLAEAILVSEGRAVGGELWALGLEALDSLPDDDHVRRARLHGHLVNVGFYVDDRSAAAHAELARREAELADDPLAELAAIRARHMTCLGPEHATERLDLAARLGDAARSVGRPSVELWEPLWRIDALVELGRLPDAVATLPALRRAVAAAGSPIARWHLARTEAALAQATGRFADSLRHGEEARDLFARLEDRRGADAMFLGLRVAIELHAGWTDELDEAWRRFDLEDAPAFLGELPLLAPAMAAAGRGDLERAHAFYDRLQPAQGWRAPTPVWLHMHAVRLDLAVRLDRLDDLPPLLSALERYRGFHVASGGAVVTYLGPVELWSGIGAAALGDREVADRDLATAGELARAAQAPGFAVQADVERAAVLVARDRAGDAVAARALLRAARPVAVRLGMRDVVVRLDGLLAALPPDDDPLSPREREVAALVAEGRTNREIAEALFVSERTAQNHVQHILTKLGVANRTQIAAWYRDRTSG